MEMRKSVLALIAALAMSIAAAAQTSHSVTGTWLNADSATAVCSSTVTTNCADHQTLSYQPGSATAAAVVATSTLKPGDTTFTIPVPANNTASTWYLTLVVNWKDASGTAQTTTAATCGTANTPAPCAVTGVPITVPAPTNFTATAQ
jgi:hypothetical protein